MGRRLTGIRRRRAGWEAYVRIDTKLYTKQFPLDHPMEDIRAWREDQIKQFATAKPVAGAGSFEADVKRYRAIIETLPTKKQKGAHLELWLEALGRTRASRTITAEEIEQWVRDWLKAKSKKNPAKTLAPATVRKRRTTLQSFFVWLNGEGKANPARGICKRELKPGKAEARWIPYADIKRIIATMPTRLSAKKGTDRGPSLAPIRASVLAFSGIPPGMLQMVQPHDLAFHRRPVTVRVEKRLKGGGVEARTVPLSDQGAAAFKAFHDANAYGKFAVGSVNVAFKRAARRCGFPWGTLHQYDLRHSFGTEMYRRFPDKETVGRMMAHAPNSPTTGRYVQGANHDVNVAAAAAFSKALRKVYRPAPVRKSRPKLAAKVGRRGKSLKTRKIG